MQHAAIWHWYGYAFIEFELNFYFMVSAHFFKNTEKRYGIDKLDRRVDDIGVP